MKIQKLDKRYKLYNRGLSKYMIEFESGVNVIEVMKSLYGPGEEILDFTSVQGQATWFYKYRMHCEAHRNNPLSELPFIVKTLTICIYIPKEEYATFLAMAMSYNLRQS